MHSQTSQCLDQMANLLNLDQMARFKASELLPLIEEEERIRVPIAIYVACQIQEVQSVTGEVNYGNGVTLTQVPIPLAIEIIRWLDDQVDIERFFQALGGFISNAKPQIPEQLQSTLEQSVAHASMSFRIYKKFDKCLSLLGIKRIWRQYLSALFQCSAPTQSEENEDRSNGSSTPIFNQDHGARRPEDTQQTQQNDQAYLVQLKNLAWIQFLLLRQEAQNYQEQSQSIVSHPDLQRTMLLIAHISLVVLALPDGFTSVHLQQFLKSPELFAQREHRKLELSVIISQVSLLVAPQFQTTEGFEEDVLQQMTLCCKMNEKMRVSVLGQSESKSRPETYSHHMFEEVHVNVSYRKFHARYEKLMGHQLSNDQNQHSAHFSNQHVFSQLDEECFLRQKVVFTPNKKSNAFFDFKTGKPENGDSEEQLNKRVKLNDHTHMTPIRKQSASDLPLFQRTPIKQNQFTTIFQSLGQSDRRADRDGVPQATPISMIMQQNEWLKNISTMHNTTPIEDFMAQVSENYYAKFVSGVREKIAKFVDLSLQAHASQSLLKFYMKVLERMINNEALKQPDTILSLLQNNDFIYALLAITIETHQHIIKKEVRLNELLGCCGISTIEFWRIISNFANFHERIPPSITQHLFDLENKVLLYWIWQDRWEYVLQILMQKDSEAMRYFEDVMKQRLQRHLGLRVIELAAILEIEDSDREKAWQILWNFMEKPTNEPSLWREKHLDMFVLGTFYMILKQGKRGPEFKRFKLAYEKKMPQEQTKIVFTNLIQFYNDVFLVHFKQLLPSQSKSSQVSLFNSPLPHVVPKPFLQQSPYMRNNLQAVESIYEFGSPAQPRLRMTPQIPPFQPFQGEIDQNYMLNLAGRITRSKKSEDS